MEDFDFSGQQVGELYAAAEITSKKKRKDKRRGRHNIYIRNIIMNWVIYAILSAFFASLVAIFGKIGIKGVDSNLAVAIRTVIIVIFAWGIVWIQGNT